MIIRCLAKNYLAICTEFVGKIVQSTFAIRKMLLLHRVKILNGLSKMNKHV